MALGSKLLGIEQQLVQGLGKIVAIGFNRTLIIYLHVGSQIDGVRRARGIDIGHMLNQLLNANTLMGIHLYILTGIRGYNKHTHHTTDEDGVGLHSFCNITELLLRDALVIVAQHLGKAVDNVERRTYLVGYILQELVFLLVGLMRLFVGLGQILVHPLGLLVGLLQVQDMTTQGQLHLSKIILQATYHILTPTEADGLVEVAVGNVADLAGQVVKRLHHHRHYIEAEHQNEQQTKRKHRYQNVEQFVVAHKDIALVTNQRHAPWGFGERLIEHHARLAIHLYVEHTLLAGYHLVTKRNQILLLGGVGIVEDGTTLKLRGIGMHNILAIGTQQHDIRFRIRLIRRYHLRQPVDGQVG